MNNKRSERRKAKRQVRRALIGLIGKGQTDHLRSLANAARKSHNLCLCGDDERHYATQADADNDRRLAEICGECGKKKLLIAYMDVAPENESERITVRKVSEVK